MHYRLEPSHTAQEAVISWVGIKRNINLIKCMVMVTTTFNSINYDLRHHLPTFSLGGLHEWAGLVSKKWDELLEVFCCCFYSIVHLVMLSTRKLLFISSLMVGQMTRHLLRALLWYTSRLHSQWCWSTYNKSIFREFCLRKFSFGNLSFRNSSFGKIWLTHRYGHVMSTIFGVVNVIIPESRH